MKTPHAMFDAVNKSAPRWARRLNKYGEETGPLHMLGANNKPICGAKVRAVGGCAGLLGNIPGCVACLKIVDRKKETP